MSRLVMPGDPCVPGAAAPLGAGAAPMRRPLPARRQPLPGSRCPCRLRHPVLRRHMRRQIRRLRRAGNAGQPRRGTSIPVTPDARGIGVDAAMARLEAKARAVGLPLRHLKTEILDAVHRLCANPERHHLRRVRRLRHQRCQTLHGNAARMTAPKLDFAASIAGVRGQSPRPVDTRQRGEP